MNLDDADFFEDPSAFARTLRIAGGGADDEIVMVPVPADMLDAVTRYLGFVEAQFFGRPPAVFHAGAVGEVARLSEGTARAVLEFAAGTSREDGDVPIDAVTAALDCSEQDVRDAVTGFDRAVRERNGPGRSVALVTENDSLVLRVRPWAAALLRDGFDRGDARDP